MASLQARHTRKCALNRLWTTFAAAAPGSGCTCKSGPMYHVVSRSGGRLVREPIGHNRREAERRLRAIQVEIDQEQYSPPENVSFTEWADRWLAGLRREETTRRTYQSSLVYAKQVIGNKPLRKVTTSDVRAFLDHIERVNRSRETPARRLPDNPGEAPAAPGGVSPGGEDRAADRREPGAATRCKREAEGTEEEAELLHG